MLAPAASLVFLGHHDGASGKQCIAVLIGSKKSDNVPAQSPELKNDNPASMLFVFSL